MSATAEPAKEISFRVRPAEPSDAPTLVDLINELAQYERLAHESRPDADALAAHLSEARCEALIAEHRKDGEALGFALFFQHYSTFLTRWGMYLEDLYVRPEWRGHGVGFELLRS
ncbi:MAG TPA: GNAT family N-acetyltransferase, partial [Rhodothermales bacterium]